MGNYLFTLELFGGIIERYYNKHKPFSGVVNRENGVQ